ncbi:hypothetical protein [Azospirillum sp. sgz302134]
MQTANVNDPKSVEALYSRADFEKEARLNSQDKTTVQHGLMILSEPGPDGTFSLQRANRHVGEAQDTANSVFLCPLLNSAEYGAFVQNDTAYGGPVDPPKRPSDRADPYRAFIDDVIQAARTAHFPPGVPAECLKGFHGG